jgi:ubiquinone/menaquinone biosynthesis C-methylase UbiE
MPLADESSENQIYKNLVDAQLRAGPGDFCPFRREKQMDHLLRHLAAEFRSPGQKVLDICGGYGRLTYFINEFDPRQQYYCLDSSEALIAQARESFGGNPNIHCEVADLYQLSARYDKAFDITINYKTLYCLPYYKQAIEQFVRATRRKIYITSPFFEGDIDFISRIYPNASQGDENRYTYSNSYGIPKFVSYCKSLGVKKVEFEDMRLDFDLPPPASKDTLQTHTVRTVDQGRLEMTGALLLDWKLAILTL